MQFSVISRGITDVAQPCDRLFQRIKNHMTKCLQLYIKDQIMSNTIIKSNAPSSSSQSSSTTVVQLDNPISDDDNSFSAAPSLPVECKSYDFSNIFDQISYYSSSSRPTSVDDIINDIIYMLPQKRRMKPSEFNPIFINMMSEAITTSICGSDFNHLGVSLGNRFVLESFQRTGLSIELDGSQDHLVDIVMPTIGQVRPNWSLLGINQLYEAVVNHTSIENSQWLKAKQTLPYEYPRNLKYARPPNPIDFAVELKRNQLQQPFLSSSTPSLISPSCSGSATTAISNSTAHISTSTSSSASISTSSPKSTLVADATESMKMLCWYCGKLATCSYELCTNCCVKRHHGQHCKPHDTH